MQDAMIALMSEGILSITFSNEYLGIRRFEKMVLDLTNLTSKKRLQRSFSRSLLKLDLETADVTADFVIISCEPGDDEAVAVAAILSRLGSCDTGTFSSWQWGEFSNLRPLLGLCRKMYAGVAARGTSIVCPSLSGPGLKGFNSS